MIEIPNQEKRNQVHVKSKRKRDFMVFLRVLNHLYGCLRSVPFRVGRREQKAGAFGCSKRSFFPNQEFLGALVVCRRVENFCLAEEGN